MKWASRAPGASIRPLMMELPDYHWPNLRNLAIGLWERVTIFLTRVGGIILALMMLLWFLSSFPAPPPGATGRRSNTASPAARRALQVVFAPIGFNWQISHRAGAGAGGARGRGRRARHRLRTVGHRRRHGHATLAPLIASAGAWPRRCRCWRGTCSRRSASPRWRREARDRRLALPAHGMAAICSRSPTSPRSSPIASFTSPLAMGGLGLAAGRCGGFFR
jgi:hypothetical protein